MISEQLFAEVEVNSGRIFIDMRNMEVRPVARIFRGGGGAYLKNLDQLINWCLNDREDSRTESPTKIGTNLMVGGNFESAKGASPLGGVGVCSPRTFWNLKTLKHHLQHSQADSYVKKVPKIDRYFLLIFDQISVVITCNIF